MNDKKTPRSWLPVSRRKFVKSGGAAAAVIAMGLSGRSHSSELPRVDENGAMAKALNYVHDARNVDAALRPSDRYCYNCVLYAGSEKDEWAGCSIFPGKAVAGAGWCNAWAPKQSG